MLRVSSRPVSNRSKARGAAEIVGQSVIPIRTLPSPSTQGRVCHQKDLKGRSWSEWRTDLKGRSADFMRGMKREIGEE